MFEDAKASRGARRRRSAGTRRTLRLTMFSCLSERSTLTSLSVVFRTTASSSDSLNFFTATTSPVFLSRHLSTTPYAPSPTTPTTSYLFIARERARARRATPGRTAVAEDPPPPRAHLSRRRGPPPAPSPTPLRHANVSPHVSAQTALLGRSARRRRERSRCERREKRIAISDKISRLDTRCRKHARRSFHRTRKRRIIAAVSATLTVHLTKRLCHLSCATRWCATRRVLDPGSLDSPRIR